MKIIFVPLKFIQLVSSVVITAAIFSPCEITRKDHDKGWLYRTRYYNIYEPSLLHDFMVDDTRDAPGTGGFFQLLYAAIGFSIPTTFAIAVLFVCHYVCNISCYKLRLIVYICLLALWIPFTFAFVWMVSFGWQDDVVLCNYGRPSSWVVAAGGCLTLVIFVSLELTFTVMALSRNPNFDPYSVVADSKNNSWAVGYWRKGSRLAVSLNSIDLDPNGEKLKPDEI